MKSVGLVQIFHSVKETNRTHRNGYVEDLPTKSEQKRYAKMVQLNLSVLSCGETMCYNVRK
nr:secretion protein HlyD [uncultured Selenomonas sp.]